MAIYYSHTRCSETGFSEVKMNAGNISEAMKQTFVAFEEMAQTIDILSDTIKKLEAEMAYLKEYLN